MKLEPTKKSHPEYVVVSGTADDPISGTGMTADLIGAHTCGPEGDEHYTLEELEAVIVKRKIYKGQVMTYEEWNTVVDTSYRAFNVLGMVSEKGLAVAEDLYDQQMQSYVAKQKDVTSRKDEIVKSFGETMYKGMLKQASGTDIEVEAAERFSYAEGMVARGEDVLKADAIAKVVKDGRVKVEDVKEQAEKR